MRSAWKQCRGQSILEYLVIATIAILAVLGIRQAVSSKTNQVLTNATDKIGDAADSLANLNLETPN